MTTQIAAPWGYDAYAEQQLIEMRHCEPCPWRKTCTCYGEPFDENCQSLKDWENKR